MGRSSGTKAQQAKKARAKAAKRKGNGGAKGMKRGSATKSADMPDKPY